MSAEQVRGRERMEMAANPAIPKSFIFCIKTYGLISVWIRNMRCDASSIEHMVIARKRATGDGSESCHSDFILRP